jgi:hypothetical protein
VGDIPLGWTRRCLEREKLSCYFAFAALIFAHRAFWAAAILALPSALIFRRAFFAGFEAPKPFAFAHRAFCAAAILFLVAALNTFFFTAAAPGTAALKADPPSTFEISFNLAAMSACSFTSFSRTERNWATLSDEDFM